MPIEPEPLPENIFFSPFSSSENEKSIRRILELDDEVLKKMPKEIAESIRPPFINDLKAPKRIRGDFREDADRFFSKFDEDGTVKKGHPLDEGIRRAMGLENNPLLQALKREARFSLPVIRESIEVKCEFLEDLEEDEIEQISEEVDFDFDVEAELLSEMV